MKKRIITATSAAIVMMSGLALNSQAVTQSINPIQSQENIVNLKAADTAKEQKSVNRTTERVFIPRKAMAGAGEQRYIVQFEEEPLTSYQGTIKGLKATAPNKKSNQPGQKLDAQSPDSQAYLSYLKSRQDSMKVTMNKTLGRKIEVKRTFQAALNGMSVKMTQDEAQQLATLPGISKIELDREDFPNTDRGPTYIGAPELWNGMVNDLQAKGEGIVIGILDSGINGDHPSFAAMGGDGYVHTNPLGEGNYLGECDPNNDKYNPAIPCNSKLIGRYLFIDATPTETDSEDTDGHGSHVASTAGGNAISAPVFDAEGNPIGLDVDISGVAPHANIIAFQVCAPSCFGSDRVAAIEQAILDGQVDVLNHSIGSNTPVTINPWTDAVDLAFLSARAAGISVANSMGNNGPNASTLGSSGAPWMTNSGSFTHDREIQTKYIDDFAGGDTTPPPKLQGRGLTAGYGPAPIVYAADYSNGDAEPAQCLVPFPEGTWTNGEIVVCDRGTIARTLKCSNVRDGGAAGCVLTNIDGGASGVSNDAHVIPAIHLEASEGNAIKAWLSSGSGHMATISDNLVQFGSNSALGSIAASSSSRGPHLGQDYLPVSVGAPGVDIYAALANGTEFGFLSGTSMASPHTAGASALLKQVQPQWSAAEILSALATTASTAAFKEDGITPADPFDMGGGVIRVDLAASAGLLLDETIANFEAANPALGGDPKSLNVAGLVNRTCVITCSWVRTFKATTDGSWTVTTSDPSVTVSPDSFDLLEGESQSLVITVNTSGLENGVWVHEQVTLVPSGDLPTQHLTVSFTPASGKLPDEVNITATRDADSYLVSNLEAGAITDLQISIDGLTLPTSTTFSLFGDSNNGSPYDNLNDGVAFILIDVPSDATRLVAATTDALSESPDVDLRVGFDANGNGMPDENEQVCASATATAEESCDLVDLESGEWWVMVQNWQASGANADNIVLKTVVVHTNNENMVASGPSVVAQATPFDLRLMWNLPDSVEGTTYYGTVTLGADSAHPDNIGVLPVTLTRGPDDVIYQVSNNAAAVGDTVTFSIEVAANISPEDRNYTIEATVPQGFSLVAESVSNGGVITDGKIEWNVSQASLLNAQPGYRIVTSLEDPACAMPFANSGAYIDLEQLGILPQAPITGDTVSYSAFSGQNFNFYGESFVGGFNFTDDGFVFFDSTSGSSPWNNLPIPDASDPNSLLAILWRDMQIPTPNRTPGSVVGVSLATAGANLTIIEYDNMQAFESDGQDSIDFEMAIRGVVSDAPGVYEIMMAFDNINTTDTTGTIGVENANGTSGSQYAFNNVNVTNGMAICYDLVAPSFDSTILTYQVTVDASAAGSDVVSELTSNLDTVGTEPVTESQTLSVEASMLLGDWDGDGDVDSQDISEFTKAILAKQTIDMSFDLNSDGVINILDARALRSLCTRTSCATN